MPESMERPFLFLFFQSIKHVRGYYLVLNEDNVLRLGLTALQEC